MLPLRILTALTLALAVLSGSLPACSGWVASAQARMSCCAEGIGCATSHGEHESSGASAVSQAEADRCCALSQGTQPAPTASVAVVYPPLATPAMARVIAPPAALPAPEADNASPPHGPRLRRHVLLSVFLV